MCHALRVRHFPRLPTQDGTTSTTEAKEASRLNAMFALPGSLAVHLNQLEARVVAHLGHQADAIASKIKLSGVLL